MRQGKVFHLCMRTAYYLARPSYKLAVKGPFHIDLSGPRCEAMFKELAEQLWLCVRVCVRAYVRVRVRVRVRVKFVLA